MARLLYPGRRVYVIREVQLSKEQSKNLRVLERHYAASLRKANEYSGSNSDRINKLFDASDRAMNRLLGAARAARHQQTHEVDLVVKKFRGYNKVKGKARIIDEQGRKLAIPVREIYIV